MFIFPDGLQNQLMTNNTRLKTGTLYTSLIFAVTVAVSCKTTTYELANADKEMFDKAQQNAAQANEGFVRCNDYMNAWLSYADPESKLVPRTLDKDKDIWNANDCAADNFPFLVLTSFFTDQKKYQGIMHEMLESEIRLTSRVKSLPDTYSFSKNGFVFDSVSMPRIVFGTTEYIKDGLLPVTEWLGATPWSERMLTMLDDLNGQIDVAGGFGANAFGNAPEDEVNGELLQILSRVYWMTGDEKYLDWAVQIGDHFLNHAHPLNAHYLRLRDHGCEIVSGLCELYVTLHFARPEKKASFRTQLYRLLDHILEHGRNEDGLFYNAINPRTREVVDSKLADTWGYTLNGFYSVYMVDRIEAYREAVTRAFENLDRYRRHNWENLGADGYADAIEGALNLYNRLPDDRAARWIDSEIQVMWSIQDSSHRENAQKWKGSGIIEGWYGDGNFARTSLMYNLWKSKGIWVQPWNQDVYLGAESRGDTVYISLGSNERWEGTVYFDKPRHAENFRLPVDWPRINQFPEWFTVSADRKYRLIDIQKGSSREVPGITLLDGLPLVLEPGETRRLIVVAGR